MAWRLISIAESFCEEEAGEPWATHAPKVLVLTDSLPSSAYCLHHWERQNIFASFRAPKVSPLDCSTGFCCFFIFLTFSLFLLRQSIKPSSGPLTASPPFLTRDGHAPACLSSWEWDGTVLILLLLHCLVPTTRTAQIDFGFYPAWKTEWLQKSSQ